MSGHRFISADEMPRLAAAVPPNVRLELSKGSQNRTHFYCSVAPLNELWRRESTPMTAAKTYELRWFMEACGFGASAVLLWDMEPQDLPELDAAIATLARETSKPTAIDTLISAIFGMVVLLVLQDVDMALIGKRGTGIMRTHDGIEWIQIPLQESYVLGESPHTAAETEAILRGMGFEKMRADAEVRIYVGQWKVV